MLTKSLSASFDTTQVSDANRTADRTANQIHADPELARAFTTNPPDSLPVFSNTIWALIVKLLNEV